MRDGANACEFLPWDSSFFGFRIGRIRRERLTRTLMLEVDEWASEHRMDCLYVLSDPEDHLTVDLVHQHGLRLTDVSVTLRLAAESVDDSTGWRGDVRPARAADVPALRALAASNHRHSRFYYDGRFPPARCDELFATWIEKSCSGYADHVLIAHTGDEVGGYVTLHLDGRRGRIGLFGTGPPVRRTGCAQVLMRSAIRWFRDSSVEHITVVTQARNVPALRFYERSGFIVRQVRCWYHWWRSWAGASP